MLRDGVTICNCSICTKKGIWHLIVPPEQFRTAQRRGRLATYQFNTKVAKHTFCKACGVHPFYVPRSDPDKIDVNARCLDDFDLARADASTPKPSTARNWEGRAMQEATCRGDEGLAMNTLRARRRNPRRPASPAGAGLLRGHRLFRHRLSRQLSALHGARPHQLPAPARRRPARAVRGGREGGAGLCLRGALDADRLPQARAHGRRARDRHHAARGEGRLDRAAPAGHPRRRHPGRGDGAGRVRLRRPGPADPQGAARRH